MPRLPAYTVDPDFSDAGIGSVNFISNRKKRESVDLDFYSMMMLRIRNGFVVKRSRAKVRRSTRPKRRRK